MYRREQQLVLVLCVMAAQTMAAFRAAGHDELQSEQPCSQVDVREIYSNINGGSGFKEKRAGMWFGPRLGKRNAIEDDSSSVEANDFEAMLSKLAPRLSPDSQWIVYLVSAGCDRI